MSVAKMIMSGIKALKGKKPMAKPLKKGSDENPAYREKPKKRPEASTGKRVQGRDYADKTSKLTSSGVKKEGTVSKAATGLSISQIKTNLADAELRLKKAKGSQAKALKQQIEKYKKMLEQQADLEDTKAGLPRTKDLPASLRKQAQ